MDTNEQSTFEETVRQWRHVSAELKALRNLESDLRQKIVDALSAADSFGQSKTATVKLGNLSVKATKKTSLQIMDQEALTAVFETLPPPVKECFTWSPKVILSRYKMLQAADREAANSFLVEKEAAPMLAVTEIKSEGRW